MTATHQLEATLRSLKLSGMLDTLEARLVQARAGELGHLEFLQVLCEDEASRRAAAAVSRRMKAARFDEQVSMEEFDFTVSAKLPVATLRDLATLRFLDRGESVVLHGPVVIDGS
jgi:DNA replication protein DnaC